MRKVTIATTLFLMAGPVLANPPLREVQSINDGLLVVGLADGIRKNCDSISGNIFKGIARLRSIHKSALKMGYSKEEIQTFVDDPVEKDRLKARGRAYLKANGASQSKPETVCALGRKEIAKKSAIGTLLYEN
ncbi:DUF5333 domain-containing protein [Amylibacter sp.]|jgi:hypothetical protein|nr:DUF5333 domain-containing protein [Amylibacter sp.]MDB9857526.1 DUF5333 domain-containing protein [Amylibacter sp.]